MAKRPEYSVTIVDLSAQEEVGKNPLERFIGLRKRIRRKPYDGY